MNIAQYGILHLIHTNGDMPLAELQLIEGFELSDLYSLVSADLLIRTEDDVIYPVGDDEASLKATFDVFRKKYPGSKRGLDPEWADFKKKHKKIWRKIVPQLLSNLERQEGERELLENEIASQEKKGVRNHGLFVPSWQNLSTYLNGSNWSRVFFSVTKDVAVSEIPAADTVYGMYRQYWIKKFGRLSPAEEIFVLQLDEYKKWETSSYEFVGRAKKMAIETSRAQFWEWHSNFFNSSLLQKNYRSVFYYMVEQFRLL